MRSESTRRDAKRAVGEWSGRDVKCAVGERSGRGAQRAAMKYEPSCREALRLRVGVGQVVSRRGLGHLSSSAVGMGEHAKPHRSVEHDLY